MSVFILLLLFQNQTITLDKEIKLETGGRYLDRLNYSTLQKDGTLLIPNKHRVFHFSNDGSLLKMIGQQGEGPGEFLYAYSAYWDGRRYYIYDSMRYDANLFDGKGDFIQRYPSNTPFLFLLEDHSICMEGRAEADGTGALTPFLFEEGGVLKTTEPKFHSLTPKNEIFQNNFKQVFITGHLGKIFVMEELSDKVTVYNTQYQKVGDFKAGLRGYIEPEGDDWSDKVTRKERLRKIYSFSRVHGIGSLDAGLVIYYNIPNPDTPDTKTLFLTVTDYQGKALTLPVALEGFYLGTFNNRIYLVEEMNDLSYVLKVYRIGE